MKKYLAEFTGSFAIVFFGTGIVVVGDELYAVSQFWISLIFGSTVMAMIYLFGKSSGAHFNPAVSIAFAVVKKFPLNLIFPYLISQLAGGLTGSLILHLIFRHNEFLGSTNPSGTELQSLIIEFFLTFFLMLVIMLVSHGFKEVGKYAALLIGTVVFLEAYFAGNITGASMNPARSFGPAIVSGHLEHLWIYFIAPIAGASASAFCWKIIGFRLAERSNP